MASKRQVSRSPYKGFNTQELVQFITNINAIHSQISYVPSSPCRIPDCKSHSELFKQLLSHYSGLASLIQSLYISNSANAFQTLEKDYAKLTARHEELKLIVQKISSENESMAQELSNLREKNISEDSLDQSKSSPHSLMSEDPFRAGEIWRASEYQKIQDLSDKDNFELLRKITLSRESISLTPEEQSELINQLNEQKKELEFLRHPEDKISLIRDMKLKLKEKQKEINLLIQQTKGLEETITELKIAKNKTDAEILRMKKRYRTQSQELDEIKEAPLGMFAIDLSQSLDLKGTKYEQLVKSLAAANEKITCLQAQLKSKESEEIDGFSHTVYTLKLKQRIEELEESHILQDILQDAIKGEILKFRTLLEEEKKVLFGAEHWKRHKKEYTERIERTHIEQNELLHAQIHKTKNMIEDKNLVIQDCQEKYAQLAYRMKKEHDSKVIMVECLQKEKETQNELNQIICTLNNEKSLMSETIRNYENDNIDKDRNAKDLEIRLNIETENSSSLRSTLNAKINEINTLENELDILQMKFETSEKLNSDAFNDKEQTIKELQDKFKLIEEVHKNIEILEEKNRYLSEEVKTRDKEIQHLNSILSSNSSHVLRLIQARYNAWAQTLPQNYSLPPIYNESNPLSYVDSIIQCSIELFNKKTDASEGFNYTKSHDTEAFTKKIDERFNRHEKIIRKLEQELKKQKIDDAKKSPIR